MYIWDHWVAAGYFFTPIILLLLRYVIHCPAFKENNLPQRRPSFFNFKHTSFSCVFFVAYKAIGSVKSMTYKNKSCKIMLLLDAKSFKYIKITASKSFWWYTDSSIPIPASALAVYKLGERVQSPGKGALPRTLRVELGKIQGQAAGDWLNDLWMHRVKREQYARKPERTSQHTITVACKRLYTWGKISENSWESKRWGVILKGTYFFWNIF